MVESKDRSMDSLTELINRKIKKINSLNRMNQQIDG